MSPLPGFWTPRALRTLAALAALVLCMPILVASPAAGRAATDERFLPIPTPVNPPPCSIGAKLVPTCGAYLGVAANPLDGESYDQAMRNWEIHSGRTMDIAHYYMRGEGAMFPTASQIAYANQPGHQRLLLLNWRPTRTWRDIANGASDAFLQQLATYIKTNFNKPMMMTLHAEMESEVNPIPGFGMTAIDFRDFFRHTVDVLKANGATKIVFIVDYIGAPNWGDKLWFNDLYPGDKYADWIGEDPFAFGKPPVWLCEFPGMVDRVQNPPGSDWHGFYTWAQTYHPTKPIMLAEWGVDEAALYPQFKATFFKHAVAQMADYPMVKALVYWDHPGAETVGETRIDSSPQSLAAFAAMVHTYELTEPGRLLLKRDP